MLDPMTVFLHLEASCQRAGTDDEPVYLHEKMMLEPTTAHILAEYQLDGITYRSTLQQALGAQMLDLLTRFLAADRLVQRGEMVAAPGDQSRS